MFQMVSTSKGDGVKTRHTSVSKLRDFLGGPAKFLESEVPTLRDVMRKGLLLQEKELIEKSVNRRNLTVRELSEKLAEEVMVKWSDSNPQFVPPVVIKISSLVERISTAWSKLSSISLGKEKKKTVETWTRKLDTLLDITVCKCPITLCSDSEGPCSSNDCSYGAHNTCSCPGASKLPLIELQ